MASALVLGSQERHGLAAIRSLGSREISVTAASPEPLNMGRFSRYADAYVAYPSPEEDEAGFVRAVGRELRRSEFDAVIPIREEAVRSVVANRSRFEEYTNVPFPPYDRLLYGTDKRRTIEAARQAGVPHPETLFSDEVSIGTIEDVIGYPVVVKAAHGEGGDGFSVCETRRELETAMRRHRRDNEPVLFQEFIPNGGECGVYTLYNRDGELSALTVQRRLRTYPPEGGASSYRETIEDPTLVTLADDFLTTLDWEGVAMVEFRVDARTGEPKLMEINPRLWGSLALSLHAGVDFPYLLYRLAVGDDIEPNLEYDSDVQARFLSADFRQVLRRGDRLRALGEFLTPPAKPCRFDVVSARDPLPAVAHFVNCLKFVSDDLLDTEADADEPAKRPTTSIGELGRRLRRA